MCSSVLTYTPPNKYNCIESVVDKSVLERVSCMEVTRQHCRTVLFLHCIRAYTMFWGLSTPGKPWFLGKMNYWLPELIPGTILSSWILICKPNQISHLHFTLLGALRSDRGPVGLCKTTPGLKAGRRKAEDYYLCFFVWCFISHFYIMNRKDLTDDYRYSQPG